MNSEIEENLCQWILPTKINIRKYLMYKKKEKKSMQKLVKRKDNGARMVFGICTLRLK